jgi:putative methyltransferase (TIGR04325 family)
LQKLFKTFKQILLLVLPPLLAKGLWVLRAYLSGVKTPKPVLEYAPQGWNTEINTQGWNSEKLIEAEASKWSDFCKNLENGKPLGFSHENTDLAETQNEYFHNIHLTYAYVLTLAARSRQQLSVLDVGGGLGHYYMLGKSVLPGVKLDYHCLEVAAMCNRGRKLCPEIQFHENDKCLEQQYDLIMINGSLGYFKNWKELLRKAAGSVLGTLFLTRVLVVRKVPSFVVLQRTHIYNYDSDMLTQVFNRQEILDTVESAGLKRARDFIVGGGPNIVGAPEPCRDEGWLFQK